MNQFGDERKISLAGRMADAVSDELGGILMHFEPRVLGVTYWECHEPWEVPERRIGDNFCLIPVEGEYRVAAEGREHILRRGEIMIVPEFAPHRFGLAPGCRRVAHFIVHALAENLQSANPFALFDSPFQRLEDADGLIRELFRAVELRNRHPDAAALYVKTLLRRVFCERAASGNFALGRRRRPEARVGRALEFIEANHAAGIAVADIARRVNLGEARFRRLFRDNMGTSPADYLKRVRLQHATRLLARYDMPLKEVAAACGFANERYFCTVFRRCFDRTPGQYRLMIRK